MQPITVAGMVFLVVMTGMAMLTFFLFMLRRLAARLAGKPAGAGAGPTAGGELELGPEIVAVLAAAASAALEAPVVLHQIHVRRGPAAERWSRAGRMDIMISHRVEPRR